MMIGTALLALVLAIGRAWLPGNLPTWSSVLDASGLNRMENVTIFLIFSVVSLIVKLPCIWIALAARKHVLPMAVGWVFSSGTIGFLEISLMIAVTPVSWNTSGKVCFYLCLGHMAMATAMLMVLGCLRQFGYSMTRRHRKTV